MSNAIGRAEIGEYLDGYLDAAIFTGMEWDYLDCDGYSAATELPRDVEVPDDIKLAVYTDAISVLSTLLGNGDDTLARYAEQRAGSSEYGAWELIGHDAHLTANGHGTGLWDRGIEQGEELTDRLGNFHGGTLTRDTSTGEFYYE